MSRRARAPGPSHTVRLEPAVYEVITRLAEAGGVTPNFVVKLLLQEKAAAELAAEDDKRERPEPLTHQEDL